MTAKNGKGNLTKEGVYATITEANLAKQMSAEIDNDENVKKSIRRCIYRDRVFWIIIATLFAGLIVGNTGYIDIVSTIKSITGVVTQG